MAISRQVDGLYPSRHLYLAAPGTEISKLVLSLGFIPPTSAVCSVYANIAHIMGCQFSSPAPAQIRHRRYLQPTYKLSFCLTSYCCKSTDTQSQPITGKDIAPSTFSPSNGEQQRLEMAFPRAFVQFEQVLSVFTIPPGFQGQGTNRAARRQLPMFLFCISLIEGSGKLVFAFCFFWSCQPLIFVSITKKPIRFSQG